MIGQPMEPITDTDGEHYQTVKIGEQIWMAENLRRTTFECVDGVQVKLGDGIERGPGVRFYDGTPRYAYYKNAPEKGFGVLYNYSVVEKCQLCPLGYRMPSKADWESLVDALGGESLAGHLLLKKGTSGFMTELGGRIDSYGSVLGGSYSYWWSSDYMPTLIGERVEVYAFRISYKGIVNINGEDIRIGNYIRCIKE